MRYFSFLFIIGQTLFSQNNYEAVDTEVWDPEPKIVSPGNLSSPPSDAIILFDGTNFSNWHHSKTKKPVNWELNNDKSMTIRLGTGSIETKMEHGSIQLHIEWKSPKTISGKGQSRGNSGIFLQRRYEIQVLDSYKNRTYSNGQASSIYKQYVPLVNASLPPGEWQTYDIIFNEPKYNSMGTEINPGYLTVIHNGILVHNNVQILGTTENVGMPKLNKDDLPGEDSKYGTHRSLLLQDHGDGKVSYRNIWIRKL